MKTKLISASLSAILALSALPVMADATDDTVYSYTDENGQLVEITQADLDEGHWNKAALGDTAPAIYEEFPMKMTGFANDFGELSLDLEYLKKLSDMDNVHFKIKDLNTDSLVYDEDLNKASFYSPQIEVGGQYEVTLSETVDNTTSNYVKVVFAEKSTETLPECILNPSEDDTETVLIADIDSLQNGISINDDGSMEINRSAASYDKVTVSEFYSYCESLADDRTYRIFINVDGEKYAGYVSTFDGNVEVYDLVINTYTWEDLYAPAVASLPSGIDKNNVENYAVDMGLTDAAFRLRETSNNAKFRVYRIVMPNKYVNGTMTGKFKVTITGTSKLSAQIFRDAGTGNISNVTTITTSNSNVSRDFTIDTNDYNACSYMDFYFMVYFPSAVEGYGMISFSELDENSNFSDDVSGSVYEAITGEGEDPLSNRECSLNTPSDVDAFAFKYYGTKDATYKITVKNRSLADQALLDSGKSGVSGAAEKYLTFWSIYGVSYTMWEDTSTYTIPKNTDITVYNEITDTGDGGFKIHRKLSDSSSADSPYQIAFERLG